MCGFVLKYLDEKNKQESEKQVKLSINNTAEAKPPVFQPVIPQATPSINDTTPTENPTTTLSLHL